MIHVKHTVSGARHELVVQGHAGSEKVDGIDMVCAAVSGVVYTLAAWLDVLRHNGKAGAVVVEMSKGDARVGASPRGGCSCAVSYAFDMVMAGMTLLSAKYPGCISCDCCEGDK